MGRLHFFAARLDVIISFVLFNLFNRNVDIRLVFIEKLLQATRLYFNNIHLKIENQSQSKGASPVYVFIRLKK